MIRRMTAWLARPWLASALCGLVFVAAAVLAMRGGDTLRYDDEKDYHRLALGLCSGAGYVDGSGQPSTFRPPGYSFFLSVVYRGWTRPLAGKLANAVSLALAAGGLAWLVSRTSRSGMALVPLLFLGYPVLFYSSSTLYPQTVGTLVLAVCLGGLALGADSRGVVAASGALYGALVLMIPSFLLLVPVLAVCVVAFHRPHWLHGLAQVALFSLCMGLVVMPWTLRNARVTGRLIPISSNSGLNLLLGNSGNATARSGVNADIQRYVGAAAAMDEASRDAYYQRCALDWMAAHPRAAAGLYLRKLAHHFHFRNVLYTRSEGRRLRDGLMFLTYYPLLLAVGLRCAFWRRFPFTRLEGLVCMLYVANAFASAVFFTRIRFRLPFDALLLAVVAGFVGRWLVEGTGMRDDKPAPSRPT